MKYVVAVSGGVDSVVLLDMLVKSGQHELIVAHFDHGIREESAADARFVRGLAERYGLVYRQAREELGRGTSEEQARTRRYAFLKSVAANENAKLVTAHHGDDLIESIAINLSRGTGWRGLAVLNDMTIERPLLRMRKSEIYEYALAHGLEWVEDETNLTDAYLRNRLRRRLSQLTDATKTRFSDLRAEQCQLAGLIDEECGRLDTRSRYFLTMVDDAVGLELLRSLLLKESLSLTRPRRRRLLHAIKTALPGSTFQAGDGVRVGFTVREFIVKHPL